MVAIKDFEMPKNCGECYLTSIKSVSNPWDMICSCNLKDIDINERTRAEHCPLVEIKEAEYGKID